MKQWVLEKTEYLLTGNYKNFFNLHKPLIYLKFLFWRCHGIACALQLTCEDMNTLDLHTFFNCLICNAFLSPGKHSNC